MGMDKQIKPFRGYRYNTGVAGKPETLLAPPYDVIYPDMQEALYNKNQYNVVRLILGKMLPGDTENNNRYTRSAIDLNDWIKNGILVRDEKPAIYVYSQMYDTPGGVKTRTGFMARKKLEDFGGSVVPHENTFAGPKADRLNLTRACKCNFSPIFGLYTDQKRLVDTVLAGVMQLNPDAEVKMDDGQTHKLWAVTDVSKIDAISAAMDEKKILIADGHHRYETALNYFKENSVGGKHAGEDLKYVLMYFTNTESEGLSVFATHRVINHLESFNLGDFVEKLSAEFDIDQIKSGTGKRDASAERKMEQLMKGSSTPIFGFYSGNGDYAVLRIKKAPDGGLLEKLDVAILHDRILSRLLDVKPQSDMANQQIYYGQDIAKCAQRVDDGISKLAFFLNPTPIRQMSEVSLAGLKMPQKSTYFYPKLISGMVINPLF
jgi:uncharacterized protein (DUF1015 family)